MSIDSVLASAPNPRGCSLPLTHTSNGYDDPLSQLGTWPINTAKLPSGWRTDTSSSDCHWAIRVALANADLQAEAWVPCRGGFAGPDAQDRDPAAPAPTPWASPPARN